MDSDDFKYRGDLLMKYAKAKELEDVCIWLKSFGKDLSKIKIKCEVTEQSVRKGFVEKHSERRID